MKPVPYRHPVGTMLSVATCDTDGSQIISTGYVIVADRNEQLPLDGRTLDRQKYSMLYEAMRKSMWSSMIPVADMVDVDPGIVYLVDTDPEDHSRFRIPDLSGRSIPIP